MKYVIGFIISSVFTLGWMVRDILSWFNGGSAFTSSHWVILGMLGLVISMGGILRDSMTITKK